MQFRITKSEAKAVRRDAEKNGYSLCD